MPPPYPGINAGYNGYASAPPVGFAPPPQPGNISLILPSSKSLKNGREFETGAPEKRVYSRSRWMFFSEYHEALPLNS